MLDTAVVSKKTAIEAHREVYKVYTDDVLSETTCRDLFRGFKDGDLDVVDRPREERPKTFENAELEARSGSMPNATRVSVSIRTYPPRHFQEIVYIADDLMARNLSSL
ncbi:hypothetical protein Trydic_g1170 [Trypoxylus dichotomus]